jgi:hypothetical protein
VRLWRLLLPLALLLALVAGCSLGGDDEDDATGAAATTAPAREGFRPRESGSELVPAITVPEAFALRKWVLDGENVYTVRGTVTLDDLPVSGARVVVGGHTLREPTDGEGSFEVDADATRGARREVTVGDLSEARVDGYQLSPEEVQALEGASGFLTVGYTVDELEAEPQDDGTTRVVGRVTFEDGSAPTPVSFFSYELVGSVTDADGGPVADAIVSTRTLDRDHWTVSEPSDEEGRYVSLFGASAREAGDPVPFDVRVAIGDDVFQYLFGEHVLFRRLKSARMNIQLPPEGFAMALPATESYDGAIYSGVLVGVTDEGEQVTPVSATWPDDDGRFELVLPASVAGRSVSVWAASQEVFQEQEATPGGPVNVERWPTALDPSTPQDLTTLELGS